ncbi:hypothetical protein H4R19_000766 [Coemansia spiralis]|nr:hypothetical protein H4R19_000766 [Coemansia spiralis]
MSDFPHTAVLTVPFGEVRLAQVACASLAADSELSSDKVERTMRATDTVLEVEFRAESLRMLRVSVNGFMDSLILVAKTIEAFA